MNLIFNNEMEFGLWQQFTIAALRSGATAADATSRADDAVRALRDRIPRVATAPVLAQ